LLDRLADRFDEIILDSPPLGAVADGRMIAATCHGTVLVARAQWTSSRAVGESYRNVKKVGGEVVGVVLNGVTRGTSGYRAYDAYSGVGGTARWLLEPNTDAPGDESKAGGAEASEDEPAEDHLIGLGTGKPSDEDQPPA